MNIARLNNHQYGLLFDVRRSIRYHDRRCAFFTTISLLALLAMILVVVLRVMLLSNHVAITSFTFVLTFLLFGLLDLYAKGCEHLHSLLKVKFIQLEATIIEGGYSQHEWMQHQVKRLNIEQYEPPIYRALDILCHNEVLRATGHEKERQHKLGFIYRLTCHIFHWQNLP